jgi:hypothetical protein
MEWTNFIYPILGGIFVFILANSFLKDPIEKLRKKWNLYLYKVKNSGFRKNKTVKSYFHTPSGYNKIDLVAYQFGLRPNLPIIDLLYLELLKNMQSNEKIEKIVIFPTIDKSSVTQNEKDLDNLTENLKKVFCHNPDCFEIINPFRDSALTSKELIEENFIDTLSYLGNQEFYNNVYDVSKHNINGIQDFNKYHKKDKAVMTLITHVFKAWEVREYILNHIKSSSKEKMNIGFIFWEVEYDKWGIYNRTAKDDKIEELTLLIGKSIFGKENFFSKYKPIPVFTRDALGVFDEKQEILEKITRHNKTQVKALIEIISTILQDNYKVELSKKTMLTEAIDKINSLKASNKIFSSIYDNLKEKLTDNEKVLFTLILKLRSMYGC